MKKQKELLKEAVATKQLKIKLVQHLRDIPIATYACQRVGVPKATYYKWRKIDDAFREASDEAIISGKLTLNDVAKSQLVKLIKEGDYRSISFWLKHNDNDFNPRLTLEIEDGTRKYTKEELEEMALAMRNAGLVGVSLAHQKMEKVFRESIEKDRRVEDEKAEYSEDIEIENTDNHVTSLPKSNRKPGVNIAKFMKKNKKN